MKRLLSSFFLLAIGSVLFGQGLMERKKAEIFPTDGKKKQGGFYLAPGLTYTQTRFKNSEETLFSGQDTSYAATLDPNGALAFYLEAGWFHALKDPYIFDYWDAGLAYKRLKGSEDYLGVLRVNDQMVAEYQGMSNFTNSYVTAHFNVNKLFQLSDRNFIQASIGANADYRIGNALEESVHVVPTNGSIPPGLLAQAHVKLGYGMKLNDRLIIIPQLETPVFSVSPTDQGFGALQWFNSLYRPVIFSVRIMWLRYPNGFDCPEVKSGGGKRKKQNPYKPKSYHP